MVVSNTPSKGDDVTNIGLYQCRFTIVIDLEDVIETADIDDCISVEGRMACAVGAAVVNTICSSRLVELFDARSHFFDRGPVFIHGRIE